MPKALALVFFFIAALVLGDSLARAAEGPSGLALPRFATTRSSPINVRVGPGTRYDVAWVYVKAGMPVEIVQEFDTWRKVRDADGSEGWIHQNLLSGKRAGFTRDVGGDGQLALLANRDASATVRAWLTVGFPIEITRCDGSWCEVSAISRAEQGGAETYRGYLPQDAIWGVYAGEEFD